MPRQSLSWTCSACAIDWVALATALDPTSNREKVVGELGYPACINAQHGLLDALCAVRYMERWGVGVEREWVDWPRALELCQTTTGLLNSLRWQHFVAIRGVTEDGDLWVANSAPGWQFIWDRITRLQFEQWAGSWQAVFLVR